MSLYNDLTQVFTQYANEIKNLRTGTTPFINITNKSEMTDKSKFYKYAGKIWYWNDEWKSILDTETIKKSNFCDMGDFYTLLELYEDNNMTLSGYTFSISNNVVSVTANAQSTIHFFDVSDFGYANLRIKGTGWSDICYYNPNNQSYTLLVTGVANNKSKLLPISSIPSGCYLCVSSPSNNWTINKYKYIAGFWLNPDYTPKFDTVDESISPKADPLFVAVAPLDSNNGMSYYYIDMSKYKDCVFRLVNNKFTGDGHLDPYMSATASDSITELVNSIAVDTSNLFGDFIPWIYDKQYLILIDRYMNFWGNPYDISIGWIDPAVAKMRKSQNYWNAKLTGHNTDRHNAVVINSVFCTFVDIDISKSLDGQLFLLHDKNVNGHTVATTNFEDLGLDYSFLKLNQALQIFKRYGAIPFCNMAVTITPQQAAEIYERIYRIVGNVCVYANDVLLHLDSPLYGHLGKYYIWVSGSEIDPLVAAGADVNKIIADTNATSNTYTTYDWINVVSINPNSAADIPNDGTAGSVVWMNSGAANILNG